MDVNDWNKVYAQYTDKESGEKYKLLLKSVSDIVGYEYAYEKDKISLDDLSVQDIISIILNLFRNISGDNSLSLEDIVNSDWGIGFSDVYSLALEVYNRINKDGSETYVTIPYLISEINGLMQRITIVEDKINNAYSIGYYSSTENYNDAYPLGSVVYLGTTYENFTVNSDVPYLWFTDGSTWTLINKYIEPDENKIYIWSSSCCEYRYGTNSTTIIPAGFFAFIEEDDTLYDKGGVASFLYPQIYDAEDHDTFLQEFFIKLLKTDHTLKAGLIPQTNDYNYLFSISVDNYNQEVSESGDKPDFRREWTLESSFIGNNQLVNDVYEQLHNNCDGAPASILYEVDSDGYIGNPLTTNDKSGSNIEDENSELRYSYGILDCWKDPKWIEYFLECYMYYFLIKNLIFYNDKLGWHFSYNGSGTLHTGCGTLSLTTANTDKSSITEDDDSYGDNELYNISLHIGGVQGCIVDAVFTSVVLGKYINRTRYQGTVSANTKAPFKLFGIDYNNAYIKYSDIVNSKDVYIKITTNSGEKEVSSSDN